MTTTLLYFPRIPQHRWTPTERKELAWAIDRLIQEVEEFQELLKGISTAQLAQGARIARGDQ